METGRRVWNCEVSTIDTGFLIAGMLTAATYFDREDPVENQIREIADFLYRRVDWRWATNGKAAISHGWKPETGFIPYCYEGYDEGSLLYVLALGSPTYGLGPESYQAWTSTFQWKQIYDWEYLYSGPLFTHQLSHLFIDFKGIRDAFMRSRDMDYFENSRRATYIHREYAIKNPLEYASYGETCWGFTACDGPGWFTKSVLGGESGRFFDYVRLAGRPFGPDDGTIVARVGGRRLAAVRPRDCPADDPVLQLARPGDDRLVRVQDQLQPDVRGGREPVRLGFALLFRDRPRSADPDDRKLSDWTHLVGDQALPLHRRGTPPRRFPARLVVRTISGLVDQTAFRPPLKSRLDFSRARNPLRIRVSGPTEVGPTGSISQAADSHLYRADSLHGEDSVAE